MWKITYTDSRSATGIGTSIAATDEQALYLIGTQNVIVVEAIDTLPVFTPDVLAAVIGDSPSL